MILYKVQFESTSLQSNSFRMYHFVFHLDIRWFKQNERRHKLFTSNQKSYPFIICDYNEMIQYIM